MVLEFGLLNSGLFPNSGAAGSGLGFDEGARRRSEGGFGSWQLIEEVVTTSAAQTVDFSTPLTGNSDGSYLITGQIQNSSSSDGNGYLLRLNGATVAGKMQILQGSGSTPTASSGTSMVFATTDIGEGLAFEIQIPRTKAVTGQQRYAKGDSISKQDPLQLRTFGMDITTPAVTAEITSAGITSENSSGIGANSTFRIFRSIGTE